MIEALDDTLGAIIKALDDHGLRANTLVVFGSDNCHLIPSGLPRAFDDDAPILQPE